MVGSLSLRDAVIVTNDGTLNDAFLCARLSAVSLRRKYLQILSVRCKEFTLNKSFSKRYGGVGVFFFIIKSFY